jgi:exopolysaccharide biosynthesis polyprenyl glycosylphosphotransferase
MPLIDIMGAILAFLLAYIMRYELEILRPVLEINTATFSPYLPYMAAYVGWLLLMYRGSGLYRAVRGRPLSEEIYAIINGVTSATVMVMALSFIFQPLVFSRLMVLYVAAVTIIALIGARVALRMVQARRRARGIGIERVLVVGAKGVGQAVVSTMLVRKDLGYLPVGFLDDDPTVGIADLGRVRGFGAISNFPQVVKEQNVDLVVITLDWAHHPTIMQIVQQAKDAKINVRVVPDVFQLNLRQVSVENLDGIPLLGVSGKTMGGANRIAKRAMDITLILLASPVLLLAFALVAIAIRLEGTGPIFYRQKRVGENGRPFDIIKFRSMVLEADTLRQTLVEQYKLDPRHPKIPDDPRQTRVGKFIRRTSLDELPNLINVVRGQMSIVGPRPPTPDEVALYQPWHMERLKTMPGVTGLWQVSGRSDVPFDEMCLLDIYYIENWSLRLDAQILMATVPRVLQRSGAY